MGMPVPRRLLRRGMMLHILHLGQWGIAKSPIGHELRRMGVPHRFFGAPVSLRYRSKVELALRIYPALAWVTLRAAVQSLAFSRPAPTAVLVSSDVEALVFGLVRRVLRRRTLIVFQTLIITPRRSRLLNALYMRYWGLLLSLIDLGVCHSQIEPEAYARLFPRHGHKLIYIPFGVSTSYVIQASPDRGTGVPVIVSAGRSGRDYPTLARAVEGLACRLRILCDIPGPLEGVARSPQVEVVTDCFDRDYLQALSDAAFVVVPLSVDDISAGQMVLLQAAMLGRAVVITGTATTVDYAGDGEDALLVPLGDTGAMRAAILRLLDEPGLADRLGAAALARFGRDHSKEAYTRAVVRAVEAAVQDAESAR